MQHKMLFLTFFGTATKLHTHAVVKEWRGCRGFFFLSKTRLNVAREKKGETDDMFP